MRWTDTAPHLLVPLAMSALTAGCAFSDGEPWGQVDMTLAVTFQPSADRLVDGTEVRTNRDYAYRLDALEFELRHVALAYASSGGDETTSFDPANPPPGYSLCHNGHCHADDGSLPTYEEIEATLAGGEAGGTEILGVVDSPLTLESTATPPSLLAPTRTLVCTSCDLMARGTFEAVIVRIDRVRLRGTMRDLRPDADKRLLGPAPFELELDLSEAETSEPISVDISESNDNDLDIAVALGLPDTLFDDLSPAGESGAPLTLDPDQISTLRNNMTNEATIVVDVVRN